MAGYNTVCQGLMQNLNLCGDMNVSLGHDKRQKILQTGRSFVFYFMINLHKCALL